MFIVTLENNGTVTEIHGEIEKLKSGKVVKGINSIDTFSFSLLPSNIGFNLIHDFMTLVKVYNTNKNRYEFYGRVLYSDTTMAESGLITKDVTCESYFGYMCDSQQIYVAEQNWTVIGLLRHIVNTHNSQVEAHKHFTIGEVTATDPNDNIYCGIQRENTWDTIKKKLIDVLGGEIRFRVNGETIYLDYLVEIGTTRSTKISVSRNMKSIKQEKDPSAYITRLIPLGCKLSNDSETRLDVATVNNGSIYIDDEQAIEIYGIHVGYVTWDDVTDANNLLSKGKAWLAENNKISIKYSITALDLSLLGLDVDDFEVHDYYPIENALIDVDDVARLIKKNVDVCEEIKSTIEFGENLKTLSDIQLEQAANTSTAVANVEGNLEAKIVALDNKTTQKFTVTDQDIKSINQRIETLEKAEGGVNFTTDKTLTLSEDGVLSVNTAVTVEADNTLPVTSAAVHTEIGNIDALLQTI